jgi:UDP-N-acetylmuramate dehydrogenase
MAFLVDFADIIKPKELLAPYTYLKLGGPADALAQPRTSDELARLVVRCQQEQVPYRLLGGGSNILVRDEGVRGVVIRLNQAGFTAIEVRRNSVRVGAGATLTALISQAARQALAGLEALIGIPGTVGGALRTNAGTRAGYVGQSVRKIEVLDSRGQLQSREGDELDFAAPGGVWDDSIILAVEFELEPDDPESILKRLRRFWINKKAHQPLSFQPAGRIFKDPRGLAADQLIEQAGLQGTRVGGAEVSDRHANYIVAHPGATARDVLRLIDLIRSRVAERFGQTLQMDLVVW